MTWLCNNCGHEFNTPSFSEGPKTTTSDNQVVRMAQSRHICPECFSPDIRPLADAPEGFKRCRQQSN